MLATTCVTTLTDINQSLLCANHIQWECCAIQLFCRVNGWLSWSLLRLDTMSTKLFISSTLSDE